MDDPLLKHIANLAHYGGLAHLSEAEILVAIRRLTCEHLETGLSIDTWTLKVLEAARLAKTKGSR